jgi:fibro-slime domain-containing protein
MWSPRVRPSSLLLLGFLSAACASVKDEGPSGSGGSKHQGSGGTGGILTAGAGGSPLGAVDGGILTPDGDGTACANELRVAVRDFRGSEQDGKPKHPDFETQQVTDDRGLVAKLLGPDGKPVYAASATGTATTTGPANFDQWFRDVDGVNIHIDVSIPLTQDPASRGVFVYDNDNFFPIDKQGWPDPYADHNHDFTAEIHVTFPYRGGEVFKFRGDDDVWVFVNGHLAIDLGGVHVGEMGMIDMDSQATDLGIAPGNTYPMDVFYADRHCCGSTFHIETTLQCLTNIVIP